MGSNQRVRVPVGGTLHVPKPKTESTGFGEQVNRTRGSKPTRYLALPAGLTMFTRSIVKHLTVLLLHVGDVLPWHTTC